MFEHIQAAPADPILGLNDAYKKDPNPNKINLGVGVFKDEQGNTPILKAVKQAEERLLAEEKTKSYLSIEGAPAYRSAVQTLLFGNDHPIITKQLAQTAHTPGGTGALRVAAEFIKKHLPEATIWVSNPTWANHQSVFQSVGLEVGSYAYYDANAKSLDFEAMLASLSQIPEGDVVLFHGCCHNPTGIDPTPEQWYQLAKLCSKQGFLPLFDFAYQGFGQGLTEDAQGLRTFLEHVPEMLIASSFSKNFGLYNERVGALTILCETKEQAETAFTQIKRCIRTNYSNPPSHGAAIVAEILNDKELYALWESELKGMRLRIHEMRSLFVNTLRAKGVKQDFSFISKQQGMFSFSGLTPDQVAQLRREYGIYIVGSGRISVAGMTHDNMGPLCDAIAAILKD
ncbi:amino acid aminotransferase [Marinomonas primoryensis]|jgi:aspartate aminotransferase/aromatic-amino-acid transaminase|uniref:Aminotransferase n=1 Tax=Marinomonas primoryensis TaxID=178399 RepID=A0A859D0W8_9GAMM|nr:amino acid aminotransferase [Marinomonas primoryensis]QKK82508.1 aspartate/tyrosine/aromatic aminotransferase [Marinomonas primoryensis]|tara:strand:- start:124121 stop:125317 length:1197 start_codon:yes stop_codon:yes gene_type:complete